MCIELACSRRPRAFEEAHCWNIQAKFYNQKFPLVYESDTTRDSLYEEHGATLKHKCGKRIVTLPLLSFLFFSFFSFFVLVGVFGLFFLFWPSFFRPESHPDLWGNHSLHHTFLTWDNALMMMIITLLFIYNSILEQSMTLYESLRRCTGIAMNQE